MPKLSLKSACSKLAQVKAAPEARNQDRKETEEET